MWKENWAELAPGNIYNHFSKFFNLSTQGQEMSNLISSKLYQDFHSWALEKMLRHNFLHPSSLDRALNPTSLDRLVNFNVRSYPHGSVIICCRTRWAAAKQLQCRAEQSVLMFLIHFFNVFSNDCWMQPDNVFGCRVSCVILVCRNNEISTHSTFWSHRV